MVAKKRYLCIVTIFLITVVSRKKSEQAIPLNNKDFHDVDSYMQSIIDTGSVPGIAVTITRGQNIIYSKGFGVTNIQTKQKLEPWSGFHIASISKIFTATAVMQLQEKGKIDISKSVVDYLPYFRMRDDRYRNITVKQLLNHTSGMPDVVDYKWEEAVSDDGAAERYVRSFADSMLQSDPGSQFSYSNIAYDILGDLIAKTSGMSFEKYEKENILAPLEMDESSFYYPEVNKAMQTLPHTGKPPIISPIYPYNRMHAPGSTLTSNVEDLSHWLIANMYKGKYKNTQVMSPSTFATMITLTIADRDQGIAVGLCCFIYTYNGLTMYAHEGGDLGYRSILGIVPEKKLGIVILSNTDEIDVPNIYFKICDMLLSDNRF